MSSEQENEGKTEVVRVLLKFVVEDHDIEKKLMRMTDTSEDTALHKAMRSQHLDIDKLLVKEDPEFEFSVNHAQETPLDNDWTTTIHISASTEDNENVIKEPS
ncbi:hypothetical protein CQW23_18908 [Capsicum baccatum]|uniref:Ankyrin repeat-containing protein n=1 Tax=Capsicum baccatum TaxID=33114 RepID=A0A2G2W4A3_CAPBA|nr:hypothetical protein CQW23_18908 [Capsicum baccatum]